ncbi:MAG: aminopeptidase [Woeseiaceae bacterium]|nr:aminopeptidase [Woeseiaceae bacterium]
MTTRRWRLALLLPVIFLTGCYYMQAARGQLEVLNRREPIEAVIADPDTPPELADRLALVQDARRYSIAELGMPDNDSYRTYADLEREFVVWSVFAAEEFSLDPKLWCYPIVGCVSYRGYFDKAAADREAAALAGRGYDVFVGGVAAYSTLGRFADPVLNTMMRWDDTRLVGVLFHELAHQVLYIRDDTAFNESFATAVEEAGVERYLDDRGMSDAFADYQQRKAFRRELMALIDAARSDLQTYYAETLDADEKRLLKQHRLDGLTADIRSLLERQGRDADAWLRLPFNNARLLSFSLYEGRLPAFRRMLDDCGGRLECFYDEAKRVAALDRTERDSYLDALATR